MFYVILYITLALFLAGLLFKKWTWFKTGIGPETISLSIGRRFGDAIGDLLSALFSLRFLTLIKVIVLDVILQLRLLRDDFLRWFMHICIFLGFMGLLLFHAMDGLISVHLFPDFEPTLNPALFLRNLFGALALLGLVIAVLRRLAIPSVRRITRPMDKIAIVMVAAVIVSGFVIEAAKIVSEPVFDRMALDFAGLDDPDELEPLKAYWAEHYGVVFEGMSGPYDEDLLEAGAEMNEYNCLGCHAPAKWAFISYPLAKVISPIGHWLNRTRADLWLYYVHLLICFLGLIYLPFSKMFHAISSPISLISGALTPFRAVRPGWAAARRAMGLDACTHCGICTEHCSVAPIFRYFGNNDILPSEKLQTLRTVSKGKPVSAGDLHAFQEGSFICTSCFRCTQLCPAGINLQDMWLASRDDLTARGFPEPQAWARKKGEESLTEFHQNPDKPLVVNGDSLRRHLRLSLQAGTFSNCYKCRTCSNVCPVVARSRDIGNELDFAPHQIMHSLGLGQADLALGARMIWDCLTCYQCQESCPQGVAVTDVLYELKNMAYERLRKAEVTAEPGVKSYSQASGRNEGIES